MKTPVSVIVLSIIGLIYAAVGFCGTGGAFFVTFGMSNVLSDPGLGFIQTDPLVRTSLIVEAIVTLILTGMALVGSIQSLRLKPNGRAMMIRLAWGNIAYNVLGYAFHFIYVMPRLNALSTSGAPGAIFGIAVSIFGLLLWLSYSFCILYFYNRSHVRDAFNGIFPVPRSNFPVLQTPTPPADGPEHLS